MRARNFILSGLIFGAVSMFGVNRSNDYNQNQIKTEFPAYVASFEQKYGALDDKPVLKFERIPASRGAEKVFDQRERGSGKTTVIGWPI